MWPTRFGAILTRKRPSTRATRSARALVRSGNTRKDCLKSFGLNDRPTILVLGGSQGARAINNALNDAYLQWLEEGFNVIWQTGQLYIDALKKEIQPADGLWMDAFAASYARSAEMRRPGYQPGGGRHHLRTRSTWQSRRILIPSPNVAENHQTHNAQALVRDAAALADRGKRSVVCARY